MTSLYEQVLQDARHWAHRAVAEDWLNPQDPAPLDALEAASPSTLFEPGTHRPLVAAFFGGTGVGKSSLLNRLAGRAVARTGVERPTSREVSVYLHESIRIANLPQDFPMDQVRIAQHPDDARRQIMWVDMPDIDSVAQANRALVLDWLPHIDVLVYVVSPERYRDDLGWQLLRTHGRDHAWVFVLNQWDRGLEVQYDDFRQLLSAGGFVDPIVLRTDCREPADTRGTDDFSVLQNLLQEVSAVHLMRQLESRVAQSRFAAFEDSLQRVMARLGDGGGYLDLVPSWNALWTAAQSDLMNGLEWPMRITAATFAGRDANPLSRPLDLAAPASESPSHSTPPTLWDAWADGRVADAVSQLVLDAGNRGLPPLPLKHSLAQATDALGRQVLNRGQLLLRQALALPGNSLQRLTLKCMGFLSVVLPLGALGWASVQVVKGYYDSATRHLDYLGTDFAVHSLLLIALAWLLPWFAYTRLKPSIETSALRGLRAGVHEALSAHEDNIQQELERLETRRRGLLNAADALLECSRAARRPDVEADRPSDLLRRMLSQERRTG